MLLGIQVSLKNLKQILSSTRFKIISLDQVPNIPQDFDVPETGQTFKANAILKAKAFGQRSSILTVADDSGLSIDALNGSPGIHSARFAQGDFNTAMTKLLGKLTGVPQDKRTAQFVSVLALYDPNTKKVTTFTGKADGWITDKQGSKGFGYDPIFFSKKLKKTFAQASDQEKNKISHRAKTLEKLLVYLSKLEIRQK